MTFLALMGGTAHLGSLMLVGLALSVGRGGSIAADLTVCPLPGTRCSTVAPPFPPM